MFDTIIAEFTCLASEWHYNSLAVTNVLPDRRFVHGGCPHQKDCTIKTIFLYQNPLFTCTSLPIKVCLYFRNKLYRGNRVTKVDAGSFNAFASPNLPPLANMDVDMTSNGWINELMEELTAGHGAS